MPEPTSKEEYERRFHENQRFEGRGLDTCTVMPCPFCAAPDFMRLSIVDADKDMEANTTCKECGRSMKSIITRDGIGVTFEMVQTGGDDPAPWIPKMRRVDA